MWEKYLRSKDEEQPVIGIRVLERWCEMSKDIGLQDAGIITFGSLIAKDEDDLAQIAHGDFFVNLSNNVDV